MKVIIDDKIPFIKNALELYADVEYLAGNAITRDKLKDADAIIIRTRTKCNTELLEGTKVKFIASATIGYDHIDTQYCEEKGIFWTNAPGCNSGSVLQYMTSALLFYARQKNIDLKDRVLGVVGVGNVGRKIVKLAEVLDMRVVLNDPPKVREEGLCGFISLEGVLREADIISFHVPLNMNGEDKTYHLADTNFIEKMIDGSVLINTSRGEVVDTPALKSALEKGKLSDAIIDVWENEPDIDTELLDRAILATPHIAGYSADGKANGTKMAVRQFSRFFGLGLDEWEPDDIPQVNVSDIFCNGRNKSFQEIMTEICLQTYPIDLENIWLRDDHKQFEAYRGNYPVRREFFNYTVRVSNVKEEEINKLKRLGFKIKNSRD